MNTYEITIRQTIVYETKATIESDSPVDAMNKAIERLEKNLLPPMRQVHYGDASITSVNRRDDPA